MKKVMNLILVTLSLAMTLRSCLAGSKILFVFPTPSKSQMVVGERLMQLLAQNDHEVTVVSLFPLDNPIKNYRDVTISFEDDLKDVFSKLIIESNKKFSMELMNELFNIADKIGPVFMNSHEIRKLMDEEKFDLLILGFVPLNNFLVGLADHFKCPSVILNTAEVHTSLMTLVGNPLEINSVPHFLIASSKMDNFANRVQNFLVSSLDVAMGLYVDFLEEAKYR